MIFTQTCLSQHNSKDTAASQQQQALLCAYLGLQGVCEITMVLVASLLV
jgi:hypothetical protein